ncbi:hypothetical protein GGI04_001560 [Coemansia thaxteri]|nr:hypothetical protein GGI04_001560 [Coemansia thaxteri]
MSSSMPTHPENSPALSYGSHDESASESATERSSTPVIRDENRGQAFRHSKQSGAPTVSSFETDLSLPHRNRHEDRSSAYKCDPKYLKYEQLVGRNLQSFDYVSEWADVTAFLTKLSRSFEIYAKFPVVPHKETVAKRLAQCLNPALPTGVHQKALSIYEQLIQQIGSDELVADLPLYAYGLFPFMRNASLKAKPQLLGIFEDYFVQLGPRLRPCLKSITVGVLPGLEEGSVDIFNRVMDLLDKLRDAVDESFFFQTLFLIMITNSEQRESALKYLAQRLPVFTQQEDVARVCGDDASLLARALAAAMSDSKTLVLRAALDLVMTRFPLRSAPFKSKDLVLLMKHASEVVLKKDMSLNRRLYTWLLGPGDTEVEQTAYFRQYAQKYLTDALLGSFAAMSSASDHQHTVLRVLIGLTDKPTISQPVLDSIFVPTMLLLIAERDSRPEGVLPVKLASVSRMFVEMLDPFFTWSNVINQLTDAIGELQASFDVQRVTRALQLVLFFVQTFGLDDEATLQVHVPMALLSTLATLDRLLSRHKSHCTTLLSCCFARLAIELFTRIPKSLFLGNESESSDTSSLDSLPVDSLFEITRSYYHIQRSESGAAIPAEVGAADSRQGNQAGVEEAEKSAAQVVRGTGLLHSIIRLCKNISAQLGLQIVAINTSDAATQQNSSERLAAVAMEDICHLLRTATSYAHDFLHLPELSHCALPLPVLAADKTGVNNSLIALEQPCHQELWVPVFIEIVCRAREFGAVRVALSTLLEFVGQNSLDKSVLVNGDTLPKFVDRLWDALSPRHARDHHQASQMLYQLRSQLDSRIVERHLAARLVCAEYSPTGQDTYSRELTHFGILWQNLRLVQNEATWPSGSYDSLAFSGLLLLVIDNVELSDAGLLAGGDCAAGLARHAAARAWIDASTTEWEHIAETLVLLLLQSVEAPTHTRNTVLSIGFASQRHEYAAAFDYGQTIYYIDTIQRYLACVGDSVVLSMSTAVPSNAKVCRACESFTATGGSWLQTLASVMTELALTDATLDSDSEATVQAPEAIRSKAADLVAYLLAYPRVMWPPRYVARLQERLVDSLLYCVLHSRTLIQSPLLDLFVRLCQARVRSDDGAITMACKEGTKPVFAGISAISDLTLLSRLILAALTMQMSVAPLSKWVSVLTASLPYIQGHIASQGNSVQSEQDLMLLLVLPCVHALRLLLSQCAEYFGRIHGLPVAHHKSTGQQLYKRLLPLFVVPTSTLLASSRETSHQEAMSVDVLTTLLDAFDIFLSLCLRNADKVPTADLVNQRPSSRASESSAQSSASFGALGTIPIMKFVSSIFGPDDADDSGVEMTATAAGTTNSAIAKTLHLAEAANADLCVADDPVGFESIDFNLVSALAVIRDIWNAFDFGQPNRLATVFKMSESAAPLSSEHMLLREFGIVDGRTGENSGIHVKRSVHAHVTQILEHATQAQSSEVTEAMVALWTCDNPHWITRLDTNIRRGTGHGSRRRHSSVSSLHTSRTSISASTQRDSAPASPAQDDNTAVEWNWRAIDLLETVPGRTPMNVLVGLLNALHIRSIGSGAAAPVSVVSGHSSSSLGAEDKLLTRLSMLDDIALTRFIELYTRHRLTARTASPLVPHMLSMLKDYNGNAQQNKYMLPFLLRMFTELCERVANQAQAADPLQQVYSQDLCNAYARMVDNCILIAGRSFDQTTWLRRANADAPSGAGRVVRVDKLPGSTGASEATHTLSEDDIIEQILTYIGRAVIPQFVLLVPDYERQVSIAMNLMHYAIVPAFKSHMTGGYSGPAQTLTSRSQHFEQILCCLNALSYQASLMKVWKRDVWEFFCDSKFFPGSASADHATMTPLLAPHWRHLIRVLLVSEKERFAEVLAKVSSASSGPALFANREYEAQLRAISLRRLSFVIWAGAVNQYLASLPQVQEKLVDILKNSPHPAVQIEVFLCLRVLLCRVSNHHMSNFWPMLLTELMRLCLQQLNREGREDPEQANLFLSACKFLDLLFVLGTDDFLVHQWIFITDTIDALYGSRSSSSALLDQLSSRLLSMPVSRRKPRSDGLASANARTTAGLDSETYPAILLSDSDDPTNLVHHQMSAEGAAAASALGLERAELQDLGGRPLKRPIIRVRSVTSIRELDAFVHNASAQAYQTAFTLAEPDTEFIESLLVSDLIFFDFGGSSTGSAAVAPPPGYANTYEY